MAYVAETKPSRASVTEKIPFTVVREPPTGAAKRVCVWGWGAGYATMGHWFMWEVASHGRPVELGLHGHGGHSRSSNLQWGYVSRVAPCYATVVACLIYGKMF